MVPTERHSTVTVPAIRRYCAQHPNAADTVEGVRRWWLADLVCSREEIERALAELVARGEVAERSLADGTVLYLCRGRAAGSDDVDDG
jgi:hypothetical protein